MSQMIIKASIVFTLLATYSNIVYGSNMGPRQNSSEPQDPPPEAYSACTNKKAGYKAQLITPHGETISGTCVQRGDRLVLRPDQGMGSPPSERRQSPPAGRQQNKGGQNSFVPKQQDLGSQQNRPGHQGPPPEAYSVCADKKAGDKAQLVTPHGDTVTGTCIQQGNRLLLRPDHGMGRRPGKKRQGSSSRQQ